MTFMASPKMIRETQPFNSFSNPGPWVVKTAAEQIGDILKNARDLGYRLLVIQTRSRLFAVPLKSIREVRLVKK